MDGRSDSSSWNYYEPIESSILEIRDIALAPEYLVVGARWNTITVGVTTIPVGIITQEKLHTSAGAFEALQAAVNRFTQSPLLL